MDVGPVTSNTFGVCFCRAFLSRPRPTAVQRAVPADPGGRSPRCAHTLTERAHTRGAARTRGLRRRKTRAGGSRGPHTAVHNEQKHVNKKHALILTPLLSLIRSQRRSFWYQSLDLHTICGVMTITSAAMTVTLIAGSRYVSSMRMRMHMHTCMRMHMLSGHVSHATRFTSDYSLTCSLTLRTA